MSGDIDMKIVTHYGCGCIVSMSGDMNMKIVTHYGCGCIVRGGREGPPTLPRPTPLQTQVNN